MTVLKFIAVVLIGLVLAGITYESITAWRVFHAHPAPGSLIDIDKATLHLDCRGPAGIGPTVVLEAGGGNFSLTWRKVQPTLAASHRICAYDRAGQGWSRASSLERHPTIIASELHRALLQAGEARPFILAGHSRGGIFARTFAQIYSSDTAGLILIDSSVNGIAGAPAPLAIESGQLKLLRSACRAAPFGVVRLLQARRSSPTSQAERLAVALQSRGESLCANHAELAAINAGRHGPEIVANSLGSMPVIVITSKGPLRGLEMLSDEDRQAVEAYRTAYQRTQAAFLQLSSCAEQIFALQSGHDVQLDQPEIVVRAINSAIAGSAGSCVPMEGSG